MADFPGAQSRTPVFSMAISSFGYASCGEHTGGIPGTTGSSALGTANLALYIPVRLDLPVTVKQVGWMNGATVNGNTEMGVYDISGARLATTGAVAQAGVNAAQFVDITDLPLNPGYYWMALVTSSITATYFRNSGTAAQFLRIMGCGQQASAMPLPATWTFAAMATAFIPQMTLMLNSVV